MLDSNTLDASATRFQQLIAATSRLSPSELLGADDLASRPLEELRSYVELNQQHLSTCHQLLQECCHVVTEFDEGYFERHMPVAQATRELARAFMIEAWLAWRAGEHSQAADVALDAMRLGAAVRNGGLVIDFLIGIALSAFGVEFLRKRRHELDADTAAAAARTILRIEREHEPLDAIISRDNEWERIVHPNGDKDDFTNPDDLIDPSSELDAETQRVFLVMIQELARQPRIKRQMERSLDLKQTAMLRLLATELAIMAYRQRHNCWPKALVDLVPDLLYAVPLDPFSGGPLIFRRLWWRRYLLYSVGPNGRDDGGRFNWWLPLTCEGGDLCLDHEDYRKESCCTNCEVTSD